MAISIIFLFIISNISPSITLFKIIKFGGSSQFTIVSSIITNLVTFTTHSISFFFYFAFDNVYRKEFKNTFHKNKQNKMHIEII